MTTKKQPLDEEVNDRSVRLGRILSVDLNYYSHKLKITIRSIRTIGSSGWMALVQFSDR